MRSEKLMKAFEDYFDSKYSCPMVIAAEIALLSDDYQEPFYEVCEAYILELAERDKVYTANMAYYHSRAVKIAKAIQ